MEQCIDSGLKLNKCAKIGHSCDLTGNNLVNCILALGIIPGIGISELKRKCDLLLLNILNQNFPVLSIILIHIKILVKDMPGLLHDITASSKIFHIFYHADDQYRMIDCRIRRHHGKPADLSP